MKVHESGFVDLTRFQHTSAMCTWFSLAYTIQIVCEKELHRCYFYHVNSINVSYLFFVYIH